MLTLARALCCGPPRARVIAKGVLQRKLGLRGGGGGGDGTNAFSTLVATPETSRKRSLASFEDVWEYVEKTFTKEIEEKAAALSYS